MATKVQVKAFIEKIAPIAVELCKEKTRKSLPSVCIAQACCESQYGLSEKMSSANAMFGIKVGNSKAHFGTAWKDKAYSTKTKECYDGKTYTDITALFRAYDNIRDSIEDYYDMLATCSRYKDCIGVTDAEKCITAIRNAGYATSPTYITTIMSIIKTNNLTQYDECMTKVNKPDIPAVDTNLNTKFALGQKVNISAYYSNSMATTGKILKMKTGIVSRVIVGAKNPYLIKSVSGGLIGWTNDKFTLASVALTTPEVTHKVKSGDTLSAISKKFGVSVSEIVSKNKSRYSSISASFIRVGWELKIK